MNPRILFATLALVACHQQHPESATNDAPATGSADAPGSHVDGPAALGQQLVTSIDPGAMPIAVTINQGTAIGEGSANGATPGLLANTAADTSNTQTVISATDPFDTRGTVPDTAAGLCSYTGATPTRVSYVTGAKFETAQTDPMQPMAPFYFPLGVLVDM